MVWVVWSLLWSLLSSDVSTSLLQVPFLLCLCRCAMPRVTLLSVASCCSVDAAFPLAPIVSPGLAPPEPSIVFLFARRSLAASFCALAEHTRRTLVSAVGGPSFGCCAKITRELSPLCLFSLVSSEGYSGLFFGVFFVFIFSGRVRSIRGSAYLRL